MGSVLSGKVEQITAEPAQPTCLDWNQSSALDQQPWANFLSVPQFPGNMLARKKEMGRSTHSTYDSMCL